MAEFIPFDDVVQVELVYTQDTQRVANVLHYQTDFAFVPSDMIALGNALIGAWVSDVSPNVHADVALVEVGVIDLRAEFASAVSVTTGLPANGAYSVSSAMPNSVTLSITKRTALRGRSYRGRIYHVGLAEGMVQQNTVDSARAALIVAAWSEFLTVPVGENTWRMVVASRFANNQPRTVGEATIVDNLTTDGIIDSQRRRLPGRGQ